MVAAQPGWREARHHAAHPCAAVCSFAESSSEWILESANPMAPQWRPCLCAVHCCDWRARRCCGFLCRTRRTLRVKARASRCCLGPVPGPVPVRAGAIVAAPWMPAGAVAAHRPAQPPMMVVEPVAPLGGTGTVASPPPWWVYSLVCKVRSGRSESFNGRERHVGHALEACSSER